MTLVGGGDVEVQQAEGGGFDELEEGREGGEGGRVDQDRLISKAGILALRRERLTLLPSISSCFSSSFSFFSSSLTCPSGLVTKRCFRPSFRKPMGEAVEDEQEDEDDDLDDEIERHETLLESEEEAGEEDEDTVRRYTTWSSNPGGGLVEVETLQDLLAILGDRRA